MGWSDRLSYVLAPWSTTDSVRTDLARHEYRLFNLEARMADNSQALHDIADGLRGLGSTLAVVLEENRALRGEDAAESAAAQDVRAAFDEIRGKFDPVEDVATPAPLPEPPGPQPA